jgi:hypothetical protein
MAHNGDQWIAINKSGTKLSNSKKAEKFTTVNATELKSLISQEEIYFM